MADTKKKKDGGLPKQKVQSLDKESLLRMEQEIKEMKKEVEDRLEKLDKKDEAKGVEMDAKILYFTSGNTARSEKKKIKDGMVEIDGKTYKVDISRPILHQRGSFQKGFDPMFILKHDEVFPDHVLNPILPEFGMKTSKNQLVRDQVSPEVLKKTMSMKILGNMLKAGKEFNPFIVALVGVAFGGFLIYYLIMMKIIKL